MNRSAQDGSKMRLLQILKKCFLNYKQKTVQRRSYLLLKMAEAMHNDGRSMEALTMYDAALAQDSENAMAWTCKGHILLKLGKMQEAKDAFNNFIIYAKSGHEKDVTEIKKVIKNIESVIEKSQENL